MLLLLISPYFYTIVKFQGLMTGYQVVKKQICSISHFNITLNPHKFTFLKNMPNDTCVGNKQGLHHHNDFMQSVCSYLSIL